MAPLTLFVKHKDIFIIFNISLCDYGHEIVTNTTDIKHVGTRNEDNIGAKN